MPFAAIVQRIRPLSLSIGQLTFGGFLLVLAVISATSMASVIAIRHIDATFGELQRLQGVGDLAEEIDRQVAGSFVYGLSGLFYGGCTVKNGRIEEANFDTYNSMRIAEMPKVESIIMPSGSGPWGGVGEPTICVAAPAVLNAYFAATGKRIRSVPLRDQNITFA